jgi:hypothetical protein
MTDAANAKVLPPKSNLERAFFGVEGEIRDLRHMASIATMLINDVRVGPESASTIELKINPREFERIQFAVQKTQELAEELEEAFRKEFEKKPRA